jgi:hypothetical protein
MSPDMINGAFEALGGVMVCRNVLQLHRDKQVKGVYWMATGFFAAWGYWNLFFYPHLNQWYSFAGALAIALSNTVWLAQMIYYRKGN